MGSAVWAGISGLSSSSKQLDVIANNIANVNTIGYKAGKTFFADVLSQSISGGSSGSMQVGRGVEVTEVATQFSSGSFETTGNATDVSIDGDGFFMVNDADGGTYYTRAGAFHMDSDGYLIDTNGYKVQGYNFFGSSQNTITDISLKNVQSAPQVSTTFSIGANLDAETVTGETFNSTQTLYDSLGAKHTLDVTFMKTEANNYWGYTAKLDAVSASAQTYSGLKFDTDGNLEYVYSSSIGTPTITTAGTGDATATVNQEGQLYKDTTAAIVLTRGADANTWTITGNGGYANMALDLGTVGADDSVGIDLDGAGGNDITFALSLVWAAGDTISFSIAQTEVAPADINITFPALANGATIGSSNTVSWDLAGTTALNISQYASTSVMKSLSNDGYSSGLLKSLSIDKDGIIGGFFTNGQTSSLGQIVLADFDNPWGLKKMGSNLFGETVTSGASIRNVPGASGMGSVASNSLEMSNTDVATEFINMITAQKAYQASARVVTTQDTLMQELMNIKR
ncbi:MAG: flagellar basal-body rod protein FlgF [Deltaproteobacteria bacterium]|nr:flagellar basal-body rod protein FlgF [Deltaproteobacteria bacterium]